MDDGRHVEQATAAKTMRWSAEAKIDTKISFNRHWFPADAIRQAVWLHGSVHPQHPRRQEIARSLGGEVRLATARRGGRGGAIDRGDRPKLENLGRLVRTLIGLIGALFIALAVVLLVLPPFQGRVEEALRRLGLPRILGLMVVLTGSASLARFAVGSTLDGNRGGGIADQNEGVASKTVLIACPVTSGVQGA